MQGDNTSHNRPIDHILTERGITDPDERARVHAEIGNGVDGNPNATDAEIYAAIEALFGGGK